MSQTQELWADIPGYGGFYEASTFGRIRAKDRVVIKHHSNGNPMAQHYKSRVLSPNRTDKYGHMAVHIGVHNQKITVAVHVLVLLAFVGPRPSGMEACHNDGDASNNRPDNLLEATA